MKFQPIALPSDPEARIARLEAQLRREKAARMEAEAIAEKGLRDLYQNQRWMTLLQQVTSIANSTEDVQTTLRAALQLLCDQLGWDLGNAYLIEDNIRARACDVWYLTEPFKNFSFVQRSRNMVFESGVGMPGRVLATGRAEWLPLHPDMTGFLRRDIAIKAGLESACAFPIMVGSETVAILEFFATRAMIKSTELVDTMEQIGVQLGRVIERERSRVALRHDALHDSLTGLPNRQYLRSEFAAFERLAVSGKQVSALVLDLDGLKAVNDLFGHHEGDGLIMAAANCIRGWVDRLETTVPKARFCKTLVSRIGGDEFVVLLAGDPLDMPAVDLATCLHGEMIKAEPKFANSARNRLAASIGVATAQGKPCDVYQLVKNADLAMYDAKAAGRGRTVEFTTVLGEASRRRRELEQDLRIAIAERQFELYFQPILSAADEGQIRGYEALLRWNHPQRGIISPAEFIPVAEKSGLILFIGDWVLEAACETIARLAERGQPWSDRFISVNVAASQFLNTHFSDRIRHLVMHHAIDPRQLKLEITESAAVIDLDRTSEVLREVREWGVQTSLDDFGTGYSSLSYLQQLPFDTLKIDRSFVSAMRDPQSQEIVRTILELARTMKLGVVAEGIEDLEQQDMLTAMGCDFLQGFLLGHPQPEALAFAN